MKKVKIILLGIMATIIATGAVGTQAFANENKDSDVKNTKEVKDDDKEENKKSDMEFVQEFINKKEYENVFKIKKFDIENIIGNGSHYGNSIIDKAIDGNKDIWYETGTPNNSTFKNEVVITFKKNEDISKITYTPRPGGKGYLQEYKIYGSSNEKDNDFFLLTSGTGRVTSEETEIKFKETNIKRIKIVFEKANEDWAAIGELGFYKEDKFLNEINSIYKNKLENEVSDKYNNMNKLEDLKAKISNHPLKKEFLEKINNAIEILNGNNATNDKIIKPMQIGDLEGNSSKNLKISYGTNLQSLGLYANPGDKIVVYVDSDNVTKMPSLVTTQHIGHWSNWRRNIQLKPGKNIITIPEIYDAGWSVKTNKGGPIYISNPYTKEEQGNIAIRIEGGKKYPVFKEGDNIDNFINELKLAKQEVDNDKSGKVIDVVEIIGRRELFTLRTNGVYDAIVTKNKNPEKILNAWNKSIDEILEFNGLNGESKTRNGSNLYETFRVMQPFAFMYAAGDHIGFQEAQQSSLLDLNSIESGSWGFFHEIGHNFEVSDMSWQEISTNLMPIDKITRNKDFKLGDERINWENIYLKIAPSNSQNKYEDFSIFDKIGVFWQLELAKPGYWSQMNQWYRENQLRFKGENWKFDNFVAVSSDIFQKDLTEYFSKYGFNTSSEVKNYLSKYDKMDKKLWYLNSTARFYNKEGYSNKDVLKEVKVTKDEGGKNILNFNVKPEYENALLGYEILEDGKPVGFTNKNTFTVQSTNQEYNNYEIVAYAKNLTTSKVFKLDKISSMSILGLNNITINIGDILTLTDLKKNVVAKDSNGDDLSENIIISGNINFNVPGTYEIRYLVRNSNGNSISRARTIIVTEK
ncbi:MAG: M60 family metallopeptidase [Sarcina sp.]